MIDRIERAAVLAHPDIAGISFVGSSPVAKHVYELSAAHGIARDAREIGRAIGEVSSRSMRVRTAAASTCKAPPGV